MLNKNAVPLSYLERQWNTLVKSKNERVELAMKILKYRMIARQIATDPDTQVRIRALIADLERQLREIDE
jgi:hypothetical protein